MRVGSEPNGANLFRLSRIRYAPLMGWNQLSQTERAELEALIKGGKNAAYTPYDEWLVFAGTGVSLGIAALVALFVQTGGMLLVLFADLLDILGKDDLVGALRNMGVHGMFIAALVFTAWMLFFIVTNFRRRGAAVTRYGCVLVLGRKLKLIRHGNAARIVRRIVRTKKRSFVVVEVFDKQGRTLTFYPNEGWAELAEAAIERAREETVPSPG